MEIRWSKEDEGFIATCPELNHLSAFGTTQQDAAKELEIAIDLALEAYENENLEIPKPSEMESYSGQFRLRIPPSLHAWLATQARSEGFSLNTFVVSLLADARGQSRFASFVERQFNNIIGQNMESSLVKLSAGKKAQMVQFLQEGSTDQIEEVCKDSLYPLYHPDGMDDRDS
jgi:predicted HicB family RNase H-like nuclease